MSIIDVRAALDEGLVNRQPSPAARYSRSRAAGSKCSMSPSSTRTGGRRCFPRCSRVVTTSSRPRRARPGRRSGSAIEIPAMADAPTDQNIIDPIEAEAAPEPSKLTPEERMQTFKQWFKADQGHSQKWRAQARDDFDFVAGDQWKPDDRSKLEAQGRPVITFNRTLGLIKVVTGVEISSLSMRRSSCRASPAPMPRWRSRQTSCFRAPRSG